jgi:hypothetical protein
MTDEQLKVLAELVIISDARITALSDSVNLMLERELDEKHFPNANVLRSGIEQSEALSRDAEVARTQARKFFGLDS